MRYPRWGGDGEAVQPEKFSGVEKCLKMAQNPQCQAVRLAERSEDGVHALLGGFYLHKQCPLENDYPIRQGFEELNYYIPIFYKVPFSTQDRFIMDGLLLVIFSPIWKLLIFFFSLSSQLLDFYLTLF